MYLCALFLVRNKAPLCERHCICRYLIKKSMAKATQEELQHQNTQEESYTVFVLPLSDSRTNNPA